MFIHKLRGCVSTRMLGAMAAVALLGAPLASAENSSQADQMSSQHVAMNHQLPGWAEKLKGQTIVEDAMGGKAERSAMVEQQHQRIMEHMAQDPQVQGVNTGMYNTSSMMHQYGAGGQDMLLVSDPRVEPVAHDRRREVSGHGAGEAVQRVHDQCRDHAQSVARFLSRLHVRAG